ncbi:MAG: aminotransferase class IV [Alphaproteobacteria bacterium]|nr:aminotransferase class IV [Alphaproteobacteria bacterium]
MADVIDLGHRLQNLCATLIVAVANFSNFAKDKRHEIPAMSVMFAHQRYQPFPAARVSAHDRGHTLGDGIYEYVLAWHGRLIDIEPHLDRLYRSVNEVRMTGVMGRHALRLKMIDFCRQNKLQNGGLYLQLTRGTAPREHYFPLNPKPNLTMMVRHYILNEQDKQLEHGVTVNSLADMRWRRCDIKVISLLANCLAKQWADEAGGHEVAFYNDQDIISEGGSSNLWLVDKNGVLRTHQADHQILNGITKQMVERVTAARDMKISWESFSRAEAYEGREMFLTSSSQLGVPIIMLDGKTIGTGKPGPVTRAIHTAIMTAMVKQPIVL